MWYTAEIKKTMEDNVSDFQCILKNRQKPDSFAAHLEQHIKYTMSKMDLRICIMFKVVIKINPIGAMKQLTKPKCNICMEEGLTIIKIYTMNASHTLT